ncbi:MAG: hypothetical protein J5957_00995 [Prevotella sp.]|nr:hypothetical protein [Prevotella sp.]
MLPVNIDEYASLLPLDDDQLLEQHVNPLMLERLHRIRGLYAFWLQYPNKSTKDIVQQDIDLFKISQSKAYEDVRLVQKLLGDIQAMTKDFARWRFNQMNERHVLMAERDRDHRAIALLEKNFIKANQLDKEDTPDMAFDQIVPLQIEPTDDPTVLGIRRIPDLRGMIRKMIAKYSKSDIENAQYVEIEQDEQSE